MDENEKKAAEAAEKGKDNPKEAETDAFGVDVNPPQPPKEGGEEKEKGKKYDPIPDDHPTITALKAKIEDVKKEYGGNLSGQRDVIKRLEGEIETLKKGGKTDKDEKGVDVLFKDIKWSKDLKPEEREEMTDTEIKQMDEIAAMKEAQNKMYAEQQKKGKTEEEAKAEDLNSTVRDAALELAKAASEGKENKDLANEIIEAVKMFNLQGLTEKEVQERVKMAASHVPTYKPPKEQVQKNGKPVKDNNAGGDDPFGTNKIIEEATKGSDGTYAL